MQTDCIDSQLEFQGFGRRRVEARFDGGRVTSEGGVLALREVALSSGLLRHFAQCFADYRDIRRVEHSVEELVSQRVLGIACGYEDLNDHDVLRDDALLALAAGKEDVTGQDRPRERDRGHALAGKSTLNRLELTPEHLASGQRYLKVVYDEEAIDRFLVDELLEDHPKPPEQVILDVDATDDPLHGKQEGRFFHGYYGCYCYLPLYMFVGDELLCARLRSSNIDAAAGTVDELKRIVAQIRTRWPETEIILRGDSGFAREAIMSWCEGNDVHFVLGLAKNNRLKESIAEEMDRVRRKQEATGKPARIFKDFRYRTLETWSRSRRVVGKAEQLAGKANPRFIVTSLPVSRFGRRALYEDLYCARGDMENRIKEQQLGLFADRTSTATMRANQLRLWFASVAYILVNRLRRVGLVGTELARAQVGTIRCRLLKIGATVKVSVRRIYVSLSAVYPLQALFARVLANIRRAYPLRI